MCCRHLPRGGDTEARASKAQFCGLEAVAAKALNVSERPVSSAKKNLREGAKEVVAAVNKGDLSVHAASEILRASGLALAGVGRQALKATKPTAV